MCNELVSLIRDLSETAEPIAFNPNWSDRAGYLDYAVSDTSVTQISTAHDPYGRHVLIIPTERAGNVVLFQRYEGIDSVYNANYRLSAVRALDTDEFGSCDHICSGKADLAHLKMFLETLVP
jgi:cytolysin (calcineurin-like family phosphatase)